MLSINRIYKEIHTNKEPNIIDKVINFLRDKLFSSRSDKEAIQFIKSTVAKIKDSTCTLEDRLKLFSECAEVVAPEHRKWFRVDLPEGVYQGDTKPLKLSIANLVISEAHPDNSLVASVIMELERQGVVVQDSDSEHFMSREVSKAQSILDSEDVVSSKELMRCLDTGKRFINKLSLFPLDFDSFVYNGGMEFETPENKDVITALSLIRLSIHRAIDKVKSQECEDEALAYYEAGVEIAEKYDLAITDSVRNLLFKDANVAFEYSCKPRVEWPSDFSLPIVEFGERGEFACVYNVRMLYALSGKED